MPRAITPSNSLLLCSALLALGSFNANAQTVAFDMVDGESLNLTSLTVETAGGTDPAFWSPGDWFGVAAYGAWPQGAGVPFAIADDSVVGISGSPFAGDTLGIIDSRTAPTDTFFGMVDTVNSANPGDSATATWLFDVSAASELAVSVDMAAMGDFEASGDSFVWEWSIDGGPFQPLFELAVNEAGTQVYTMEGGAMPELSDPLVLGSVTLNDEFQTFSASLPTIGSMLSIRFTGAGDGGSEAYAARNLIITEGGIAPGGPTVVLNEVLGSNTGADNEFIELYNAGTQAVDIGGWSVELWDSDAGSSFGGADSSSPFIIEAGASIEPGGFYLLATDNAVAAFGVAADQSLPDNAIENSSYTIILVQADGQPVDSVFVVDSGADDMPNRAGETFEPANSIGPDGNFLPAGFFRVDEDGNLQDGGPNLALADFGLTDPVPSPMNSGLVAPPAIALTIPEIQGAGHVSAFVGERVETSGIVTAVESNGFYLQDPAGDGVLATSDALFVFTRGGIPVAAGDLIELLGTVSEFRPGSSGLSLTQIAGVEESTVVSSGNPLPAPVVIGTGGRVPPTMVIDDDAATVGLESINIETDPNATFDPETDGVDFYESLEGMLTRIENPIVVGSSRIFGSGGAGSREVYVSPNAGALVDIPTGFGGARISEGDFNPEIQVVNNRIANLGNFATGEMIGGDIDAVVGYSFGKFLFVHLEDLAGSGEFVGEVTPLIADDRDELTIASFNVLNLDPTDVEDGQFAAVASVIVNNLRSPDIIGLQEIQDSSGPTDDGVVDAEVTLNLLIDAIAEAGGPTYKFIEIAPQDGVNGGQPGGNIRVAYLYNRARVGISRRGVADAMTATGLFERSRKARLTFNPGYIDPLNPAFDNSRKPLVAEFRANGKRIIVINNHFSSKGGDNPLFGFNQAPILNSEPDRLAQTEVVAQFVSDILARDPNANVVVLGDMNDFEFSAPIETLEASGLINLTETIDPSDAYSFIFNGNSQTLDHILISPALWPAQYDAVHAVVDAPELLDFISSDHDPVLVRFSLGDDADGDDTPK